MGVVREKPWRLDSEVPHQYPHARYSPDPPNAFLNSL